MGIKSISQQFTQKQTSKELGFSASALRRFGIHLKLENLFTLPPTNHKRSQMFSGDPKRPRMTSKEPVVDSAIFTMNKKSKIKRR